MPSAMAPAPVPLHPLTCEFTSAAEERDFRRWDFSEHARRVRASVGVGSAVLVAYAYADYLFFGADMRFTLLLVARLACAVLGVVVIASARGDRIARHDRLLQAWTAGVAIIAVVAPATRPADYQFHGINIMVVVLAFYLLVPHRFVYAAALAGTLSVAYAAVVIIGARAAHLYVVVLFLSIVLANSFGALGSRWIHRLRRTEYSTLEREHATQQRLRAEIEERARIERRLVEADRAKSLFLATMSHEIRTPLHGMMTCAHLLSRSELRGEQREYVDLIRYSGKGMIQLLDEILDLSCAEAGTLRLSPVDFDLRALVNELAGFVRPRVDAQGLALALDVDAQVPAALRGDASRLRQVLTNLLENAVKFSERGVISLSVATLEVRPHAATLRFSVRDQGPGVPEAARAAIFEPFVQGPLPDEPTSGSGLGLAICARIVEAMGGSLGVDDAPEGGSRFHFTVTLGVVTDTPMDEAPARPLEVPPLSLLVVEDDEVTRRLTKTLLVQAGHEVMLATSGLEAVALVREHAFDAVLMDIRLPGLDGCATSERIRALPDAQRAAIPIIATSANVMAGDHDRYHAAGISLVLAKPIEHAALFEALARVTTSRADAKLGPGAPDTPDRAWVDEELLSSHVEALGAEVVDALVALFLETGQASIQSLAVAVAREDAPRVAHEAHRLASAAHSAGAPRCAARAARLEDAARTNFSAAPVALTELTQAFERSMAAFGARSRVSVAQSSGAAMR